MNGALEITVVGLKHEAALALFFSSLATGEGAEYFHPHPLTAAVAHERAEYKGNDVYAVLTTTSEILGYGILRGWDEGYAVPSLGIAIAGSARGLGLGRLLMEYLHTVARMRGAQRVRLRVNVTNSRAQILYRSFGYELSDDMNGYLIGYLNLSNRRN